MHRTRSPIYVVALLSVALATGCARGPAFIPDHSRKPIDRTLVDYPGGVVLEEAVRNLTAPVDCEVDEQGNLIVAEGGDPSADPRIFGIRPDGTRFDIYPVGRTIKFPLDVIVVGYRIHAPVGGIACANGKVYVSHRQADGTGAVTAFNYDGTHQTIVSNLPAQGDHGMSDVALGRGRLWFGVGSATNSGVVGLDNWPWVKKHPDVADKTYVNLKLNGYHFKSKNPDAGLFGGPEIAVTAPYQPFNVSSRTRIHRDDFPSGAIYSADPTGGGANVEAHGLRAPRGLAFSEFDTLYLTNNGMELRGTRPVKDDPDVLLRWGANAWYGFPDFSADLRPVTDAAFQLPSDMLHLLTRSGYDEISFLIDHKASNDGAGLIPASPSAVQAVFPPLSGAQRFDFVPGSGPLSQYQGQIIVPLSGDRSPFATSSRKLLDPVGFKVVRVDLASRDVVDFIRNAREKPASKLPAGQGLIERPVAAKFAPDGRLYVVDFGRVLYTADGKQKIQPHTGRILVLRAPDRPAATTATATRATTRSTEPE